MSQAYQKSKIRVLLAYGLSKLALCIVVSGFLFLNTLFLFGQEPKSLDKIKTLEPVPQKIEEGIEIITRPKLVYEAGNLKDPFEDALPKKQKTKPSVSSSVTTGGQPAPLPSFEVQGMVWGGAMPQAVIDGKVVKVGDVIKDAEIVDITKEGVKVLYNKKIYKLSPPSSVPAGSDTSK